jgi:hypothetical protein
MVVAGSNCCEWNNCAGIEETLREMGKMGLRLNMWKKVKFLATQIFSLFFFFFLFFFLRKYFVYLKKIYKI